MSMWLHCSGKKGGVRADRGIQWTDDTSAACSSGWGEKGDVCKNTNGDKIMRRRLPREVVISRSSSRPTWTKSLSARSMPISSHVSRRAVYRADSSAGSCRPPGKATCEDHRECEEGEADDEDGEGEAERRMNRSSGIVSGWLTHSETSQLDLGVYRLVVLRRKNSSRPRPRPYSDSGTTCPVHPSGSCPAKARSGAGRKRTMRATDARRGWVGGDWIRRGGVVRSDWKRDSKAAAGEAVGSSGGV